MRYFCDGDIKMHLDCFTIFWPQYKDKFAHWLVERDVCGSEDAYDMLEEYCRRL
jgi:hypothetical protein